MAHPGMFTLTDHHLMAAGSWSSHTLDVMPVSIV
jgi:hypothetical protein